MDKKYQEIYDELLSMEDKYCDLVWFARSDPRSAPGSPDDIRAGCFLSQCAVEAAYPQETERIRDPEGSDWAHGFNSGMLASVRLMLTAMDQDINIAQDEFPCLDT